MEAGVKYGVVGSSGSISVILALAEVAVGLVTLLPFLPPSKGLLELHVSVVSVGMEGWYSVGYDCGGYGGFLYKEFFLICGFSFLLWW